jgi:hypothetical protein
MSLIKSPRPTEKKRAASQRNGKFSRGPATPEGRERMRSAKLRHGFYSGAEGVALRALGEDPRQFQEMGERLKQTWNPTDEFQEQLVARLARALWRMKRADRMQDGLALRQAKEASRGRQARFAEQLVSYRIAWANLQLLAGKVAQPGYVTSAADLRMMEDLCRTELKEAGDLPLSLFRQLLKPGVLCFASEHEGEPELTPEEEMARARRVVTQVKEIFGIGMTGAASREEAEPAARPEVEQAKPELPSPPPEEPRRQRVRQYLAFVLERLAASYEDRCHACQVESAEGPSAYDRAAEIAPTSSENIFLLRMEESHFRQIWRTSHLLMKAKRGQNIGAGVSEAETFCTVQEGKREKKDVKNAGTTYDVYENKG